MTDIATGRTEKSALILIEYVNDWLAPTGGINGQFQDREQFDTAVANSRTVLAEARHRDDMDVIHVSLRFEPTFKVLGEGKYSLRKLIPVYGSFLGEQADFFPGFEPQDGEFVVGEGFIRAQLEGELVLRLGFGPMPLLLLGDCDQDVCFGGVWVQFEGLSCMIHNLGSNLRRRCTYKNGA